MHSGPGDASSDGEGDGSVDVLASLAVLVLTDETVETVLDLVVRLATATVQGADGASACTLAFRGGRPLVAADGEVAGVDGVQYRVHRGPAIETITRSRRLNAAIADGRSSWPEFAGAALEHGFAHILALPLRAGTGTIGAILFYSRDERGFLTPAIEAGERLGRLAGPAIANMAALHAARTAQANLETSLVTRGLIGQALGLVMARDGCAAEEAFSILRYKSQQSNRKLRDIAAELVAQHERRAR